MPASPSAQLIFLNPSHILSAVELDQATLGGKWSEQGYRAEIEKPNSICLGIYLGEKPQILIAMGFTWIIDDEAHIILMAVHPQWQQQGLGTFLLDQLLNQAKHCGCKRSTLEVDSNNTPAIKLYQKLGFNSLGERPNYYGPGKHALLMWCNDLQLITASHPNIVIALENKK